MSLRFDDAIYQRHDFLFSTMVRAGYVFNKYTFVPESRLMNTTAWRYRMIQDGGQQRLCLLIA